MKIQTLIFGARAHQKPNGIGGMVPLFDGVAFGGEFGQEGTQRGGRGRREAVLLTEGDIEPCPFLVVRMEGLGDTGLVQAPLETRS